MDVDIARRRTRRNLRRGRADADAEFGAGRQPLRHVDAIRLAVDVGLSERAEHVRHHLRPEGASREPQPEVRLRPDIFLVHEALVLLQGLGHRCAQREDRLGRRAARCDRRRPYDHACRDASRRKPLSSHVTSPARSLPLSAPWPTPRVAASRRNAESAERRERGTPSAERREQKRRRVRPYAPLLRMRDALGSNVVRGRTLRCRSAIRPSASPSRLREIPDRTRTPSAA